MLNNDHIDDKFLHQYDDYISQPGLIPLLVGVQTIFGIDPGKVNMACTYLTPTDSESFQIIPQKFKSKMCTLKYIERELEKEISKRQVDLIFHEGVAFGESNGVAESGMVDYIIKSIAIKLAIPVMCVPPPTIRRFLQIKTPKGGKSKGKADITLAVYKLFGKEFGTQDLVDSYAIAECGRAICNGTFQKKLKE